jgi:hypothetical protein
VDPVQKLVTVVKGIAFGGTSTITVPVPSGSDGLCVIVLVSDPDPVAVLVVVVYLNGVTTTTVPVCPGGIDSGVIVVGDGTSLPRVTVVTGLGRSTITIPDSLGPLGNVVTVVGAVTLP